MKRSHAGRTDARGHPVVANQALPSHHRNAPNPFIEVGSIRLTAEHPGWCRGVHIARRSDADPELWMAFGFIRADELHALLDAVGQMRQEVFGIPWPPVGPSRGVRPPAMAAARTRQHRR